MQVVIQNTSTKKVKTSFKDKEGNVIPNYPTEEGEQPKKDIPGYKIRRD